MIALISLTASCELPCQKLFKSQRQLYPPAFHFPPSWQPSKCTLIWEAELTLPSLVPPGTAGTFQSSHQISCYRLPNQQNVWSALNA